MVCDLPDDAPFLRGLLGRADVVLDTFRPGVLARLGVRPQDVPAGAVACSITGFGDGGRHEQRAGHDLNYQGWAGVLHDTAPALATRADRRSRRRVARRGERDPRSAARARAHRRRRATDDLDDARHAPARELPARRRSASTAADRRARLLSDVCHARRPPPHRRRARAEVLPPPLRADRPARALASANTRKTRTPLAAQLARVFTSETLEHWLGVFENDDVCVGPVATLEEAAADLGTPAPGRAAGLGEHTERWREELERLIAADRRGARSQGQSRATPGCSLRAAARSWRSPPTAPARALLPDAQDAAYSPDGTMIAFARSGDLWDANADGSGQRRLMSTPKRRGMGAVVVARRPCPGLQRTGRRPAADPNRAAADGTVRARRAEQREKSGARPSRRTAGSRSSRRAAARRRSTLRAPTGRASSRSTRQRLLSRPPTCATSPGLRTASSSRTRREAADGTTSLVVDDGTTQVDLTTPPAADEHPVWSPTGTRIAYDDGDDNLRSVAADGTDLRELGEGRPLRWRGRPDRQAGVSESRPAAAVGARGHSRRGRTLAARLHVDGRQPRAGRPAHPGHPARPVDGDERASSSSRSRAAERVSCPSRASCTTRSPRPTTTGTSSASTAMSCAARAPTSCSCAITRAGSASRITTASRRAFRTARRASSRTAHSSIRAHASSRRARRSATPTGIRRTSTARTSTSRKVPAGNYWLVHRVNSDFHLREAHYGDDTASLLVRIAWPGGHRAAPTVSTLRVCSQERC